MRIPPARVVFSDADRSEIAGYVDEALRTGSLTLGPRTIELEREFAERHGVAHAIAVSSGTSAIEIALRILGVAGREILVPANTFFATAAAVMHAGGQPRFADVSADTLSLSAETTRAALTDDTAGVVLVHIGGLVSPEVEEIRALCDERGIFLLEDAAHAHGAAYRNRSAGTFGAMGCFSFYPTKVITSGEGGMIVTDDESVADEARIYRDQGKAGFFGGAHVRLGAAWRMSELHAAVGLVHTRRLDQFLAVRRRVAARYDAALHGSGTVEPLLPAEGCEHAYYKYPAMLAPVIDRDSFKKRLAEEHGIGMSGEVYARPLHHEPVFANIAQVLLPVAEDVCARHVCLPLHSDMTDDEADAVIDAINAVARS
ncbi:MAG: DegT/DnrJ/EryC1/StrS family aminotransferase [Actinobacteria bacterium]|nr:DegT/DnrJ/EryC1/StrS family aminotransferase [Actinomycetota bacterium]